MRPARRDLVPDPVQLGRAGASRPTNAPLRRPHDRSGQRHRRRLRLRRSASRPARRPRPTLTGGVHGLAGAARLGIVVEDRACSSTSAGVGSRPSSSASSVLVSAEDAQRVGLAAVAVQGDHQPPGEALAQRVLVDRALELADRLAVAAEGEQGVEAGLQRLQAQLVPAHGGRAAPSPRRRRRRARDRATRRARPRGGRAPRPGRRPARRGPSATRSSKRAASSELAIDGEHVAGSLAAQQLRVAERPAQQRDVALQRVDGRRRRVARPDVVDEPVDGDDLAGDERQAGEHGPLAWTAERHRLAVALGRDRPEQPDVERRRRRVRPSASPRRHGSHSTDLRPSDTVGERSAPVSSVPPVGSRHFRAGVVIAVGRERRPGAGVRAGRRARAVAAAPGRAGDGRGARRRGLARARRGDRARARRRRAGRRAPRVGRSTSGPTDVVGGGRPPRPGAPVVLLPHPRRRRSSRRPTAASSGRGSGSSRRG